LSLTACSSLVVEFLAKHCPQALEMTDERGYTPLHMACRNERSVAIRQMIDYLARRRALSVVNQFDETALHYACCSHAEQVELLGHMIHTWPLACLCLDCHNTCPIDLVGFGREVAPAFDLLQRAMHDTARAVLDCALSPMTTTPPTEVMEHIQSTMTTLWSGCGRNQSCIPCSIAFRTCCYRTITLRS
jgi:hypothetical protein